MKVVTVIGARPQFIKASVVSSEFAKYPAITEVMIHTGQHFDANMSDVFFAELGMAKPDYELNIHGGNHGEMTGRMLQRIEQVLLDENPDLLLVYGDTNSTLSGALAAAKLHIPVAHIEAGLRSFNMRMPEEINRILTDRISAWLFAPTAEAVRHLINEGAQVGSVHNVGDVMYDVALHHGARAIRMRDNVLTQLGLSEKGFVLATVHRAENTDVLERMDAIVEGFIKVGRELPVVLPLHPRTRSVLEKMNLLAKLDKAVRLVTPLSYLEMVLLEQTAAVIATDSGGVQKEAFFHKVPCITLRDETEWVELVASGWNRLVPPMNANKLADAILVARNSVGDDVRPYGDGNAAERIVSCLSQIS